MQSQNRSIRPASVDAQIRHQQFAWLIKLAERKGRSNQTVVVGGDFNLEGQTSVDSNECLKPIFQDVPNFSPARIKEESQ